MTVCRNRDSLWPSVLRAVTINQRFVRAPRFRISGWV